MPTTATNTYTNYYLQPIANPDNARTMSISIIGGVVIAAGTVLGEVAATPGYFAAYASGNVDGTQNPKCIAMYDMASDAAGNITLGAAATGGPFGETFLSAPAYFHGTFDIDALTGLDATAVAGLSGVVTTGVVAGPGWFTF